MFQVCRINHKSVFPSSSCHDNTVAATALVATTRATATATPVAAIDSTITTTTSTITTPTTTPTSTPTPTCYSCNEEDDDYGHVASISNFASLSTTTTTIARLQLRLRRLLPVRRLLLLITAAAAASAAMKPRGSAAFWCILASPPDKTNSAPGCPLPSTSSCTSPEALRWRTRKLKAGGWKRQAPKGQPNSCLKGEVSYKFGR